MRMRLVQVNGLKVNCWFILLGVGSIQSVQSTLQRFGIKGKHFCDCIERRSEDFGRGIERKILKRHIFIA